MRIFIVYIIRKNLILGFSIFNVAEGLYVSFSSISFCNNNGLSYLANDMPWEVLFTADEIRKKWETMWDQYVHIFLLLYNYIFFLCLDGYIKGNRFMFSRPRRNKINASEKSRMQIRMSVNVKNALTSIRPKLHQEIQLMPKINFFLKCRDYSS